MAAEERVVGDGRGLRRGQVLQRPVLCADAEHRHALAAGVQGVLAGTGELGRDRTDPPVRGGARRVAVAGEGGTHGGQGARLGPGIGVEGQDPPVGIAGPLEGPVHAAGESQVA